MIALGNFINNLVVLEVYYNMIGDNRVIQTFAGNKNSSIELNMNEFLYKLSLDTPNVIYSININIPDKYVVLNNDVVLQGDISEVLQVLTPILKHKPIRDIDNFKPFNELPLDQQIAVIVNMGCSKEQSSMAAKLIQDFMYLVVKTEDVSVPKGEYLYKIEYLSRDTYTEAMRSRVTKEDGYLNSLLRGLRSTK